MGDTSLRRERIRRALFRLALLGIEPHLDANVWRKDGYLAGPDTVRARALVEALEDPSGLVWAARGGYGSTRLLPALDHTLRAGKAGRTFVGFSDLTALFPLLRRRGIRCIHGPVLSQCSDLVEGGCAGLHRLASVLRGDVLPPLRFAARGWAAGPARIRGPLWGGNLTLCAAACGTPYTPDYAGAILFIEDVGEPAYRLDRMLTQLDLAGVLQAVQALLVGDLGVRGIEKRAVDERLHQVHERWGIPVLSGLPVGHGKRNAALELGVEVGLSIETEGGAVHAAELSW